MVIEGSTLTEDQTAALFEEGFLPKSEELIKAFHYELKAGVFEDRAKTGQYMSQP